MSIPEQNLDGTPHMTYFDKRRQLSFTFDAHHGLIISVASGGYAEPEFAVAPLVGVDINVARQILIEFEQSCQKFINTFEQYEESIA